MKTIIIGGVAAGMTAAAKLRRLDPKREIIVYEKGSDISYSGCGMPYFLGKIVKDEDKLIARTPDDFKKDRITVNLNHEVIQLDTMNKRIKVEDLKNHQTFLDDFDQLLIATGTSYKKLKIPGHDNVPIYYLNQLHDMKKLEDALPKAKKIAIIGGGYIGVELADNLIHLDKEVHLFQRGSHILSLYDEDLSEKAMNILTDLGVKLHVNTSLKAYHQKDEKILVETNQTSLTFDMVIEAVGVYPNTAFLSSSDMLLDNNGAIITNQHMESNIKDIYAAGDCTTYHHLILEKNVYMPLGTHANKTGRIAAENMADIKTTFPGIIGTNIIKIGDYALAKTGLSLKEAKKLGNHYQSVEIEAYHQTSYYPGAEKLYVKLIYNDQTKIIVGASLFGKKGVSDRINIMALAITKKMTAQAFQTLDFAYAPPFSPVWDPLLIAALQIK